MIIDINDVPENHPCTDLVLRILDGSIVQSEIETDFEISRQVMTGYYYTFSKDDPMGEITCGKIYSWHYKYSKLDEWMIHVHDVVWVSDNPKMTTFESQGLQFMNVDTKEIALKFIEYGMQKFLESLK